MVCHIFRLDVSMLRGRPLCYLNDRSTENAKRPPSRYRQLLLRILIFHPVSSMLQMPMPEEVDEGIKTKEFGIEHVNLLPQCSWKECENSSFGCFKVPEGRATNLTLNVGFAQYPLRCAHQDYVQNRMRLLHRCTCPCFDVGTVCVKFTPPLHRRPRDGD